MRVRSTLTLAAGFVLLMATALPAPIDIGGEVRRAAARRVTIADSSVATAKFLLAHRQQLAGEWEAAAGTLRELTRRHAGDLLPVEYEDGEPVLYWNVRDAVHAHLAAGPAELRGAYRKLDPALSPTTRPAATRPATLPAHSWPTFAGSADGSAVSAVSAAKGVDGPLYTIELVNRDPRLVGNKAQPQGFDQGGRFRGIVPAVDDNQLFFHDGVELAALDLHTGKPLPAWQATYENGRFPLDRAVPDEKADDHGTWTRQVQHTLTVTENHVYAVMGVNRFGRREDGWPGTRLVCVARQNGALGWTSAPHPRWDSPRPLYRPEFFGCPRVVGGSIYVLIRDRRADNTEAVYAACFRVSDGGMKWHTMISSARVAPPIDRRPVRPAPNDDGCFSIPAASEGRLFVQSHGALACLDGEGGGVLWLALYQHMPEEWTGFAAGPDRRPWEVNPLIISSDRVFALPADAEQLLVLDPATGRTVKRIGREVEHH